MRYRLGILCTHPIQYYSPLFRYLSGVEAIDLDVFYCLKPSPEQQGVGFGVPFEWDQDLTSGYRYTWLENVAKKPALKGFYGCNTPGIARIIHQKRFDAFLVLGWHTQSMWQAMRACWKTKTPLLVRGDSHLHVTMPWIKKMVKEINHRYFIRKFSACLAVGQWSEEYFRHYGARLVVRSPHFVDNEWFGKRAFQERFSREDSRKILNIPSDSTVFLFAGKFEEKKHPMDLILAAKRLTEDKVCSRFHILMVGDGVLRRDCEAIARSHRLPVSFAGFFNQTKMPLAYAVSDVLVLPSDGRETWGLVVNEAMACGLPALVSEEAGCFPDLIIEGRTGYRFRRGDVMDLVVKMKWIMNGKLTTELGDLAKRHVADYSVGKAAEGVYRAIAEVSRKRP